MSAPAAPARLAALGVPRTECNHCSACCSSFRVGPLLPEDVDRVKAALPVVAEAFPDHPLDDVFSEEIHRERPAVFLRKRDGFCTFFRKGSGCVIHSAAGSEEKPLVCQLFPLQLMRTPQGQVRIGVRPTCLSDHRSWQTGPPVPGEFISRVLNHPMGALERPLPVGEDVLLRVLGIPDLDTAALLSFLAQRPTREDPPDIGPWLEARLAAVLETVDELHALGPDGVPGGGGLGPVHPGTSTAQWLRRFRTWLASRDSDALGSWPEVPEALLPYMRDALKRMVFVGQTSLFPTLPWAVLAYIAAARWAAAFALHAAPAHFVGERFCKATSSADPLMERFGPLMSSLLIILEGPRVQRALVDGGPPFA
ncbi:MAG: YkgJ family cysteine cluster protein [Deltaproteobacteria bacterium]|nr:YkgJ family cysteine cluster protein [Deltaproteobacteria bacterium]